MNKRELSFYGACKYGKWENDQAGLPIFTADLEAHPVPFHPFSHLFGTGHVSVLANQWGNVNLLATDGGTTAFTPTTGRTRSGMYGILATTDEYVPLLYSELTAGKSLRYGVGYAEYAGEIRQGGVRVRICQSFHTPPDRRRGFIGRFRLENLGEAPLKGDWHVNSDVWPRPSYGYQELLARLQPHTGTGFACFDGFTEEWGQIGLIGTDEWAGSAHEHTLSLSTAVSILPGESRTACFYLGIGPEMQADRIRAELAGLEPEQFGEMWRARLAGAFGLAPEAWMNEECIWTLAQLLSFGFYDSSTAEYYVHLGGYGLFVNPDDPGGWGSFGVRETCETALVLANFAPDLAKSSLRFAANTQLRNGDLPKVHFCRKERDIAAMERESDNEIWFVLGCCEYVKTTGDTGFFAETAAFWDGGEATLWEHMRRAFRWVRDSIGVGSHGLIRMLQGDWNDYLSKMGSRGQGESVMNSGMACRAFSAMAEFARSRGETAFEAELEEWTAALRESVGRAFDREWFVRAYTDDGLPVGSHAEDRLFLNAQSWAALGGCGTREERRRALRGAVVKCTTSIGLTLMSRPYSSPAPRNVADCPIPAGEGENAGIWPQTVHWLIWALAEEGMADLALDEWRKISLRNHSRCFPDVPFGIYNGPDCYSSRHAGAREGWTQMQVWNRMLAVPMNPAVAWQAFSLRKILKI